MSNKNIKNPQSETDEKLEKLQEWIKTQPDLPQNIGRINEELIKRLTNY